MFYKAGYVSLKQFYEEEIHFRK